MRLAIAQGVSDGGSQFHVVNLPVKHAAVIPPQRTSFPDRLHFSHEILVFSKRLLVDLAAVEPVNGVLSGGGQFVAAVTTGDLGVLLDQGFVPHTQTLVVQGLLATLRVIAVGHVAPTNDTFLHDTLARYSPTAEDSPARSSPIGPLIKNNCKTQKKTARRASRDRERN